MIDTILQNYDVFLAGIVCGGSGMSVLLCVVLCIWVNYTAIPLDECGP